MIVLPVTARLSVPEGATAGRGRRALLTGLNEDLHIGVYVWCVVVVVVCMWFAACALGVG